MDEIAAARFDRIVTADTNVPTVNEVLNKALKDAAENPEIDEVTVILRGSENQQVIFINNVGDPIKILGTLAMALRRHPI